MGEARQALNYGFRDPSHLDGVSHSVADYFVDYFWVATN